MFCRRWNQKIVDQMVEIWLFHFDSLIGFLAASIPHTVVPAAHQIIVVLVNRGERDTKNAPHRGWVLVHPSGAIPLR